VRGDSLNCVGNRTKIHRRNRQEAYLVADAKCSETIGTSETDVSRGTVNVITLIEQEACRISTVRGQKFLLSERSLALAGYQKNVRAGCPEVVIDSLREVLGSIRSRQRKAGS